MAASMGQRGRRAATGGNLRHRNVTLRGATGNGGSYVPPPPPHDPGGPLPGQPHPPVVQPAWHTTSHAALGLTNAQGYDPIHYGQHGNMIGYAKVGQARNQAGYVPPPPTTDPGGPHGGGGGGGGGGGVPAPAPAAGTPLPTLSHGVRAALQAYLHGPQTGVNAIPATEAQMRRFLRTAEANGVGNMGLKSFLDPTFYRGVSDPNGGAGMLRWAEQQNDPALWKSLAHFANSNTVTNATPTQAGGPSVQALLGQAAPGYNSAYLALAHPNGPLIWDTSKQNFVQAGHATPGVAYSTQDQAIIQAWQASGGDWTKFTAATGITPQFRNAGTASTTNGTDPNVLAARSSYGMSPDQAAAYDANTQAALARGQGGAEQAANTMPAGAFANTPTGQAQAGAYNSGANQGATGGAGPHVGTAAQGAGVQGAADAQQPQDATSQAATHVAQLQQTLGQLPIDPQFEATRRILQAQLETSLSQINAASGRLTGEQNLAQSRIDTNRGVDQQNLLESMAGRGTVNSSIYGDNRALLATDYGRQQADLGISVEDQLAQLAGSQADAYATYDQGILEAMGLSAQNSASDPNAAVAQYGGGGNGNGNWKPTWTPKWKPPKQRGRHGGN